MLRLQTRRVQANVNESGTLLSGNASFVSSKRRRRRSLVNGSTLGGFEISLGVVVIFRPEGEERLGEHEPG